MDLLRINNQDNVCVALRALKEGEVLAFNFGSVAQTVKAETNIPLGHKVAIKVIVKNDKIVKSGAAIAIATHDISVGEHVHVHNVGSFLENL